MVIDKNETNRVYVSDCLWLMAKIGTVNNIEDGCISAKFSMTERSSDSVCIEKYKIEFKILFTIYHAFQNVSIDLQNRIVLNVFKVFFFL